MIEPRPEITTVVRVADRVEAREEFVCLDKNERVDPFPEAVTREMLACLSPRDFSQYPVLEPFYEEVAAWLKVPRDWLLLAGGSDPAIRHVYEVYGRPGAVGVVLHPTFAMYDVYARLYAIRLRRLEYDRELRLSANQVIAALDDDVRLVLLANPNAPTGTAFTVEELGRITEAAARRGALVLVDEAYCYFYEPTALDLVARYTNLVVTRTFSKAGGLAGARLGFLVSQPRNIDFLNRVKPMYEINGVAMRLGQYLIRHEHLLWDYARSANEGRGFLAKAFAELGLKVFTSQANFLVARPPAGVDIRKLVAALRERGYLIKGPFGDPPLTDCLRVTTASVPIMEAFASVFATVYCAQVPSAGAQLGGRRS